MELEWDAYVNISQRMKNTVELRHLYKSFAAHCDAAMGQAWSAWIER